MKKVEIRHYRNYQIELLYSEALKWHLIRVKNSGGRVVGWVPNVSDGLIGYKVAEEMIDKQLDDKEATTWRSLQQWNHIADM